MQNARANALSFAKYRYKTIKEFYINENSEEIYDFIPHSTRYICLKYFLSTLSLPLTLAINSIKLCSLGLVNLKYYNFPNIFLNKVNEGISKKILCGLPEDEKEIIPEIVNRVLKEYEQDSTIVRPKPLFMQKLVVKISEYVPSFAKIVNFWNQGGIKYSEEMIKKHELIDYIYKQIVHKAYEAGKRGEKLEVSDVKALFPKVNFESEAEVKANLVTDTIEINNEEFLKYEDFKVNADTNSIINPLMFKALYGGVQQEIVKAYLEDYLAHLPLISYDGNSIDELSNTPVTLIAAQCC